VQCSVEGCPSPIRKHGFCNLHFQRYKAHGDPLYTTRRPPRKRKYAYGDKFTNNQGYVKVVMPDHPNADAGGRVSEHVLVMSEVLGRALKSGENVHHKNAIRHDNRPDNLELWYTGQPSGARVQDLVDWAEWIIDEYK
jgi:HNH endonuclease